MIDNVALLPAYVAAGTAVLVLVADLIAPGRRAVVLTAAAVGALATAITAGWLGFRLDGGVRTSFCGGREVFGGENAPPDCSYLLDERATALMALFAVLTLGVLALSAGVDAPAGEYAFLLTASMTGGVVLAGSADLITLVVAVETLTLPLYGLVALRIRARGKTARADEAGGRAVEGAVTFLVVSVVSTAVSLLGAALLYASTGAVHFGLVRSAFAAGIDPALSPLGVAGSVLLLIGLGFKVAAVPLHAWAPPTYDGAPLPVAAYLSTASKLGGVVAIAYVITDVLPFHRELAAAVLAVLAMLTMTIGNLVALRQRRMVRLLAWSSIAQAGYILAALTVPDGAPAAFAYTAFYVLLELGAFGAVIALRGAATDGGDLSAYAGAARRAPGRAAALGLALVGLAGLPPGIAGLFAKIVVVRALVDGNAEWLAIIVALNAVIGLAYYVRATMSLFGPAEAVWPVKVRWTAGAALAVVTVAGLAVGLAPQLVINAVG